MRILIALLITVLMAQAPALAAKTPNSQDEEVLKIKKKKQAEAEKARKLKAAEEAKKKKAKELADELKKKKAKVLAEEKQRKLKAKELAAEKAEKARKAKLAKEEKLKKEKKLSSRNCTGFFHCVFNSGRSSAGFKTAGVGGKVTRKVVDWDETKYSAGSIIVRTPERALYLVLGDGEAMRYSIGVGREGFQWGGQARISMKKEWPDWRPPPEMIERERAKGHNLPELVKGGPGNPLGARAMYIGSSIYRIHGTNNASSIGQAMSSGCFRMMNADVIDLYDRVKVGARVYVYQ